MLETLGAIRLKNELYKINPRFLHDSHLVLKTYLTFLLNCSKEQPYTNYILDIPNGKEEHWQHCTDALRPKGYLDEILRYFAPLEVLDVKALLEQKDKLHLSEEDIILNLLMVKDLDISLPITESNRKTLWEKYRKKAKEIAQDNNHFFRTSQQFFAFLNSIFSVDLSNKANGLESKIAKEARIATSLLYNELNVNRSMALEICSEIIERDLSSGFLSDYDWNWFYNNKAFGPVKFLDNEQKNNYKDKFQELIENVRSVENPMDLLCALWVTKKQTYDRNLEGGRITSNNLEVRHSIPLENSIIFNMFRSQAYFSKEKVLIVFPSPYFVKAWNEATSRTVKTHFIVENEGLKSLYNKAVLKRSPEFFSLKEFTENVLQMYQYDKVLIFENNVDLDELSQSWKTLMDMVLSLQESDVFVLEKDNSVHNSASVFQKVLNSQNTSIDDIVLFSEKLSVVDETSKKFLLHASTKEGSKQCQVAFYCCPFRRKQRERRYKNTENEEQALFSIGKERLYMDFEHFHMVHEITKLKEGRQTLRHFYKEQIKNKTSVRSRNDVHFCKFSQEVLIQYTASEVCILKDPNLKYGLKYEKIIDKTVIRLPKKIKDNTADIQHWLLNEYPFINTKITKIRENASTYFREALVKQNLCFATFWYIYPELTETLIEKYGYGVSSFLKIFACSDMARNKQMDDITESELTAFLDSMMLELTLPMSEAKESLAFMFNVAIEKGHSRLNVFNLEEVGETKDLSSSNFSELIRSLKQKTASYMQLKVLFEAIKRKLKTNKNEGCALLFRFLTGLETSIVCALKWEDFVYDSDFGFYYFCIYKRINATGKEENLPSLSSFRLYPCSPLLASRLVEKKKALKEKLSDCDLDNRYILNDGDSENKPFSTSRLKILWDNLARNCKCKDLIVSSLTSSGKYKDTNLASYSGDMAKENAKYWFKRACSLVPDEIRYLMGGVCQTTFYHNYCDLMNPASLYKLHLKLARLDAILLYDDVLIYKEGQIENDSFQHKFTLSGQKPMMLDLSFKANTHIEDITVEVQTKFGTEVLLSKLLSKEEE